MKAKRIEYLNEFQKNIGYYFKNLEYLDIAFTHSSYSNENFDSKVHNERLEFLGDSVVNLIVTDLIFDNFKHLPEGDLTKIRASIICEDSFAQASKILDIPKYMLLGRGEERNGGRNRKALMADSFEAFCGSMYLDSDFETVKQFLYDKFYDIVIDFVNNHSVIDYKTLLQEEIQKNSKEKIKYKLVKEEGPDHDKAFYFEVMLGSEVLGKGKGRSKKEAEHNAAHDSLCKMSILDD